MTTSPPPLARLAVVGVGSIGQNHARVVAELENAELSGIYDADPDRAREIANAFGARTFSSLDEVMAASDGVSVAVPTAYHREVGETLLRAGKHVLVEKPIANSLEEARALVDLANEKRLTLQVGHIERFNPVLQELEAHLDHPRFIEAHRLSPFPKRSLDIGVVLDLMIHDLEIILHLVRSKVASIDAVGVPVLTKREDIANARLRFENGCVANITASRISPEKLRKIRVFQENAYLSLDYQEQTGHIFRREGLEISREEVAVEKDEPLKRELRSFAESVATGTQPKVSGHQGMAALELALEVTRLIEAQTATAS
ncbi:MAG: Gfo/Idh/MocA family oxidoreductase [Verrucomicrobiota bacterium]